MVYANVYMCTCLYVCIIWIIIIFIHKYYTYISKPYKEKYIYNVRIKISKLLRLFMSKCLMLWCVLSLLLFGGALLCWCSISYVTWCLNTHNTHTHTSGTLQMQYHHSAAQCLRAPYLPLCGLAGHTSGLLQRSHARFLKFVHLLLYLSQCYYARFLKSVHLFTCCLESSLPYN